MSITAYVKLKTEENLTYLSSLIDSISPSRAALALYFLQFFSFPILLTRVKCKVKKFLMWKKRARTTKDVFHSTGELLTGALGTIVNTQTVRHSSPVVSCSAHPGIYWLAAVDFLLFDIVRIVVASTFPLLTALAAAWRNSKLINVVFEFLQSTLVCPFCRRFRSSSSSFYDRKCIKLSGLRGRL